jgi:hypothetical protein
VHRRGMAAGWTKDAIPNKSRQAISNGTEAR